MMNVIHKHDCHCHAAVQHSFAGGALTLFLKYAVLKSGCFECTKLFIYVFYKITRVLISSHSCDMWTNGYDEIFPE